MEKNMGNQTNEAVGDNHPHSSTSRAFDPSVSDTVAASTSAINHILGDKHIGWIALESYDILSGQDRKTDDENLGCRGFTNQRKVDPVNLKDMKGSGDKNLPHPVKDSGQDRNTNDDNLGCNGFTNERNVDPVNLDDMKGSGDKNLPHPVKDSGQDRNTNDDNLGCNGFTNERNVDPVNLEDMKGSGDKNLQHPVKVRGQDCKTDDENLGCSDFTNQRTVDPVNLKDMKGSGDKNLPHPVKDLFQTCERRAEYKSKVISENDQILGSSMNSTKDRQMQIDELDEKEIYNAVKNGNTIPIPEDMVDPRTPPCNTKMYVGGYSCTLNDDEGKLKMSCAMASRNTY